MELCPLLGGTTSHQIWLCGGQREAPQTQRGDHRDVVGGCGGDAGGDGKVWRGLFRALRGTSEVGNGGRGMVSGGSVVGGDSGAHNSTKRGEASTQEPIDRHEKDIIYPRRATYCHPRTSMLTA